MMFRFIVLCALASVAAATVTPQTLVDDFETLFDVVGDLWTDMNAFPSSGGTLDQITTIHNDVTAILSQLNSTVSDVLAYGRFSENDSGNAELIFEEMETENLDALQFYVDKQAAFDAVDPSVSGLFLEDLLALNASVYTFQLVMNTTAASLYETDVCNLGTPINHQLAIAIGAYTNQTDLFVFTVCTPWDCYWDDCAEQIASGEGAGSEES